MSKKFTGITSAGSAIPVYDKDAHSALQNKADVSALTAYQEKGDYYSASNPSGFLTAVPAGYATTGDLEDLSTAIAETFQPQSAMTAYLTAVPEGYATVEDVESATSGKLDSSAYSAFTPSSQFGTVYIDGSNFEASNSAIRGSEPSATYITHGGTVSTSTSSMFSVAGQKSIVLKTSLGAGMALSFKLSKSGRYGWETRDVRFVGTAAGTYQSAFYIDGELSSNYDVKIYNFGGFNQPSTVSYQYDSLNQYYPGVSSVAELAWKSDIPETSGLQEKSAMTAYQPVEGMTAYQPVGEYYSASNPSGFITGVDLTPYQTIEGMSAYQPSGDYLTAVPDTYLQNTDLSTTDGKITAISGIPLSAGGGDVPEGVMSESGLGFNAANEISGYNGSAISQYGAEKQWLTHDDTLVHLSNSAQYALGVNLSGISADLARLMGIDETVLWSGTSSTSAFRITLDETCQNFKMIRFEGGTNNGAGWPMYGYTYTDNTRDGGKMECSMIGIDPNHFKATVMELSGTDLKCIQMFEKNMLTTGAGTPKNDFYIKKVIGVGRKN